MPGAGTVQVIVKNNSDYTLSPFRDGVVVKDGEITNNSKEIGAGAAKGKAGAFSTEPDQGSPLTAISVYDLPGTKRNLILLIVYKPESGNNSARAVVYDESKSNPDMTLLNWIAGGQSGVSNDYKLTYLDDDSKKRLLHITGNIGNELDATATYILKVNNVQD